MRRIITIGAVAVFLAAALGMAGNSDLEEAMRAQEAYCQDVRDGVYSDWRHLGDACLKPIPLE